MRAPLLEAMDHRDVLPPSTTTFVHLFGSWFNRGFLVLRRIDWRTPANVLEKIIRYEAVHEIHGWDDLRRRLEPADRRCFAFFHPQLVDEPLIFVEVALTRGIPRAIGADPVRRSATDRARARDHGGVLFDLELPGGLRGVSFGNFLIKQVVEEISRQIPRLSTFVTLSPAPNFAEWLKRERASEASLALNEEDRALLETLDRPEWWRLMRSPLKTCASRCCVRRRGITCVRARPAALRAIRLRVSISATARGSSG